MKRLFLHTEHEGEITKYDGGKVYTLRFNLDREGWETDGGYEGYGLTKDVADEIANAYNATQAADALAKAARGLEGIEIGSHEWWKVEKTFQDALAAYEAVRGLK